MLLLRLRSYLTGWARTPDTSCHSLFFQLPEYKRTDHADPKPSGHGKTVAHFIIDTKRLHCLLAQTCRCRSTIAKSRPMSLDCNGTPYEKRPDNSKGQAS